MKKTLSLFVALIFFSAMLSSCSTGDHKTKENKVSQKEPTSNETTVPKQLPTDCVKLTASDIGCKTEIETIDVLYEGLDDFRRKMYDGIKDMYEHTNDLTYRYNFQIESEVLEDFENDFHFLMEVVAEDHPQYYQYRHNSFYIIDYNILGKNNDRYEVIELYQGCHLTNFEEEQEELENAANAFLEDIDTSISEYSTALQIHDKLIEYVTYGGKEDERFNNIRYQQTAYGALVRLPNSTQRTAVCEGISKAMVYLYKKCGIKSIAVFGSTGESNDYDKAVEIAGKTEISHCWVTAYLCNRWTDIDPTFDSLSYYKNLEIYDEDTINKIMADEELLYAIKHYYWDRSAKTLEKLVDTGKLHLETEDFIMSWTRKYVVHFRANKEQSVCYGADSFYDEFAALIPFEENAFDSCTDGKFLMEVGVKKKDDNIWNSCVEASEGDTLKFRVRIKNISSDTMKFYACSASPKELEYVDGSTKLFNSNYPDGVTLEKNFMSNDYLDLGSYGTGAELALYFETIVKDSGYNVIWGFGDDELKCYALYNITNESSE